MNKIESNLINFLGEDCAKMDCDTNGEREKGFFICAGSMFAILERDGLTSMTGNDFLNALDATVKINILKRKGAANEQ